MTIDLAKLSTCNGPAEAMPGTYTMSVTFDYFNFGQPVTINVPDPSQVANDR